jgi:hypothetical protein
MSVSQSSVVVERGTQETFQVSNASSDAIVLYKIRREDPKVVAFRPKFGMVDPGHEANIVLNFTGNSAR